MNYWAENWSAWVGAFLVVAIYSYLWKDNPLYRVIMQIFIGVNVGYQVVIQWRDILYPLWWIPMIDGFRALFLGGSGSPWGALWAVAGLLGLFWYFQMSRKLMWLSRIVMGVMIGITAGVTIKSQLGTNLPQLTDSLRPLTPSVVGPQPKRLFDLPAATVAPAIDNTLGFFSDGRQITCVETLQGTELWRRDIPVSRQLEHVGSSVLGGSTSLDVKSGSDAPFQHLQLWHDADSVYWEQTKIASSTGVPLEYSEVDGHLAVVPVAGGIEAYRLPDGKRVWRLDISGEPRVGLARNTLVVGDGDRIDTVDVLTGRILARLAIPGRVAGAAIVGRFGEPLEDRQYAVVPVEEKGLVAVQLADNLGMNRTQGEVLWSAKLPFQPVYGQSVDGQLLVSGPDGGAAFELPRPTKRLLWTDYLDNWVFFLTLVSVMTYFFFSFRRRSVVVEKTSVLGRYMLMIGFGAFFGNTIMTRMSYLIDRLWFLTDEWIRPFVHHFLR